MHIIPYSEKTADRFIQVLSKFDGKHADTYITSYAYHILTGRNGLTMYVQDDKHILVSTHPNSQNEVLVFPELNGVSDFTFKVLDELLNEYNQVELARYTHYDYLQLLSSAKTSAFVHLFNFTPYRNKQMDWNYPVRILDTYFAKNKGGNLRNQVNRVEAKYTRDIYQIVEPKQFDTIKAIVIKWSKEKSSNPKTQQNLAAYYHHLLEQMQKRAIIYDGFIVYLNNTPAGFSIWELPNGASNTANGLASLSYHKTFKGASDYLMWETCRRLVDKDIPFLNLGGSEEESLDAFKSKAQPSDKKNRITRPLTVELKSILVARMSND